MSDAAQARELLRRGMFAEDFPDPRPETTPMTNTNYGLTESLDDYIAAEREDRAAKRALAEATARVAESRDRVAGCVQLLGEAIRAHAGKDSDSARLVDGETVYVVRVVCPGNPSSYDVTGGPAHVVRRD